MFHKPKRIFFTILALSVLVIVLSLIAMFYQRNVSPDLQKALRDKIGKYCLAQGGSIDIRKSDRGNATICILKNGTECDAEKFFYGQCDSQPIGSITRPIVDTGTAWGNLRFSVPEDWTFTVRGTNSLTINIPKVTGITLDVYKPDMLDTLKSSFVIDETSEVKVGDFTGEVWSGNTLRSKNDRFKSFILNTGSDIYFFRTNIFGSIYLDEIIKTLSYDPNKASFKGENCGTCSAGLVCSVGKCQ